MILAQSLQPPSPKASRWTWGIPGLLASKQTLQPEGTLPGGAWRGVGGAAERKYRGAWLPQVPVSEYEEKQVLPTGCFLN